MKGENNMRQNSWKLSIEGDALNGLKMDINRMINNTILTMQQKDVETATITAKLEITCPKGATQSENLILFPTFRHKVSAAMQFKAETTGFFGGPDYQLVWDGRTGKWNMQKIDDQMSMDDMSEDYAYSGEED